MDNLSFYVHSNHKCGMHMKMFFMVFDSFVATTVVYSFLHVSTLWLIIPQFVQYFSVFLVLFYVFGGATCLVFCGTESALLTSTIVIPFSDNIVASLCCCNVDYFIHVVAILRYDCKPALNIMVKKLFVVGTCKPWNNFWIFS